MKSTGILLKRQLPLIPLGFPLRGLEALIFPKNYKLLPSVRQRYEFELAAAEAQILQPEEIIQRGAYFMSVNDEYTYHYHIAQAAPLQVSPDASQSRKLFFESNKYSVAYATHGLFPYRGKFHPQMIKAIINIIGLKPGDVVCDPMMGSGTTLVEASIMGINSIGVELNPFTVFMSKAKLAALNLSAEHFPELLNHAEGVYKFFNREETPSDIQKILEHDEATRDLVLLSFLDTLGYAHRRKTKTAQELFPDLLRRYLEAVESFNRVREKLSLKLGSWYVIQGDAKSLSLKDCSIDGIVFSPPYSFALDYVENDRIQLEYLGVKVEELKKQMVGLRGSDRRKDVLKRVDLYFEDMDKIFRECHRVLKPAKYCVVVIGSNTRQTGGVELEKGLKKLAEKNNLPLCYHLTREIEGIRNTMKLEHIMFFQKKGS